MALENKKPSLFYKDKNTNETFEYYFCININYENNYETVLFKECHYDEYGSLKLIVIFNEYLFKLDQTKYFYNNGEVYCIVDISRDWKIITNYKDEIKAIERKKLRPRTCDVFLYHSENDIPSYELYKNGKLIMKKYHKYGVLHRKFKPALCRYGDLYFPNAYGYYYFLNGKRNYSKFIHKILSLFVK